MPGFSQEENELSSTRKITDILSHAISFPVLFPRPKVVAASSAQVAPGEEYQQSYRK